MSEIKKLKKISSLLKQKEKDLSSLTIVLQSSNYELKNLRKEHQESIFLLSNILDYIYSPNEKSLNQLLIVNKHKAFSPRNEPVSIDSANLVRENSEKLLKKPIPIYSSTILSPKSILTTINTKLKKIPQLSLAFQSKKYIKLSSSKVSPSKLAKPLSSLHKRISQLLLYLSHTS